MFGVERNVVQVAAGHGVADVSFDERAGEEREELAQQERFDAVGLLEVDGRDGLVVFEDVVSAFEVGLTKKDWLKISAAVGKSAIDWMTLPGGGE